MKKLLLSFICLFMLCITQLFAQGGRTVTGTVTAQDDKLPIPGASVRISGRQTGTITNVDGKFTITVPSESSSLIFSFVGYDTQTISVAGKPTINIVLSTNNRQLNEVVVTGVGVATEKRKVPIDVATVSSRDFAKSATVSAEQALVGQIAGAQVQQTSGQPGQNALIILRGFTNLGSSQPLILIDGVQSTSDLLNSLDPNNIDHFEVVKGSAGGMLYGAQGGNGVIQVFTKKGSQNNKLTIDISSKAGVDNALKGKYNGNLQAAYHHYVTDASGNILDANGAVLRQNPDGTYGDPQEDVSGPAVVNNKPFNLPVYNHINQVFNKAYTFQNSINMRGGTERADYAFGISNLNQQDVFSNNFNRTNLNLNLGFQPVKGLTIRNITQTIFTRENLLFGSRFNAVQSYQFIDLKAIDPLTGMLVIKPNDNIDGNNTLAEKDYHNRHSSTPRIVENIQFNYKLPRFLEFDYKYSIDFRNNDTYDYYHNQSNTGTATFFGPSVNGSITDITYNQNTQYSIASAYLRTDFKNDFHINLPIKTTTQVSYDYRKENGRYYYIQGVGLTPYPPFNISGATTKTGSDDNGGNATYQFLQYGVLVNQTIDFANLFGLSGGFRSDYASAFGGASKPFTFPRGTVYFNPSELFSSHDLVLNWKLRGAYGEAGVQPGAYDRQLTFNLSTLGTGGVALTSPNTAKNQNLRVQVTKELELGTDITLAPTKGNWFNRVTFSGSYWTRKSKDIIQNASVAPSTGFGAVLDNLVSLKSNGVDLSADVTGYTSNSVDWNLGLRFAKSRTKIDAISNNLPIVAGAFELAPGTQLGVFYGQTPLHSITQTMPGGARYISDADAHFYTLVDGNVVDTRTNAALLTSSSDLSVIGNSNPDFTASIINRFMFFKKLSVGFQFDWIKGADVYNQTRQWLYRDKLSRDFDQPVTINGQTGAFVNYYESFYNGLNPTSWFVEDGSFLRLRDASIGYDITSLVHRKWLRTFSVTLSGRNLVTFTKYKGLDPESSGATDSQGNGLGSIGQYRGVDNFSFPNLRSYQVTLNIGF